MIALHSTCMDVCMIYFFVHFIFDDSFVKVSELEAEFRQTLVHAQQRRRQFGTSSWVPSLRYEYIYLCCYDVVIIQAVLSFDLRGKAWNLFGLFDFLWIFQMNFYFSFSSSSYLIIIIIIITTTHDIHDIHPFLTYILDSSTWGSKEPEEFTQFITHLQLIGLTHSTHMTDRQTDILDIAFLSIQVSVLVVHRTLVGDDQTKSLFRSVLQRAQE